MDDDGEITQGYQSINLNVPYEEQTTEDVEHPTLPHGLTMFNLNVLSSPSCQRVSLYRSHPLASTLVGNLPVSLRGGDAWLLPIDGYRSTASRHRMQHDQAQQQRCVWRR